MSGRDGCQRRLLLCTLVLALSSGCSDAWRPLRREQAQDGASGTVRAGRIIRFVWPLRSAPESLKRSGSAFVGAMQASGHGYVCNAAVQQGALLRRDRMTPAASPT